MHNKKINKSNNFNSIPIIENNAIQILQIINSRDNLIETKN